MQWTLAVGVGLALVIVVALIVYNLERQSSAYQGTRLADEGQTHVPDTTTPTYQHYPPASGPHFPAPAPWGTIDQTLPEGLFVHNLEHGGIALLYKCTGDCSGIKNQVSQLASQLPREPAFNEVKFVATTYSHMDHPFAVLAWDYIHEMDTFDADYIKGFYNAHVDKGPEQVS